MCLRRVSHFRSYSEPHGFAAPARAKRIVNRTEYHPLDYAIQLPDLSRPEILLSRQKRSVRLDLWLRSNLLFEMHGIRYPRDICRIAFDVFYIEYSRKVKK